MQVPKIGVQAPKPLRVEKVPPVLVRAPAALRVEPGGVAAAFSLPKPVGEDHDTTKALQSGLEALKAQYESLAQSTQSQIKGVGATVQAVANRPEQHIYHVQVTVNGTTATPAEIQAAVTQALQRSSAQKQTRSMRDEQ